MEIWPQEVSANLTSDQAIAIAKQHEIVQDFLVSYPDAVEFAYYELEIVEWMVTFTASYAPLEEPTEWYWPEMVTVIVDDLTGTIKRVEVYRPPKISEGEAIEIAKGSPEMAEFLAAYPDAEIWAWYDQRPDEWVVTAYAPEVWQEVTVFVDAQTGDIKTRVAEIDWEQALDLAKSHPEVSEFLDTRVVTSVNIYYDKMSNQWSVNFASDAECVTAVIDAATGEILLVERFSWAEELEEFLPPPIPG